MKKISFPNKYISSSFYSVFYIFSIGLFLLSSCSIKKIQTQVKAVESIGAIKGKVVVESAQKGVSTILLIKPESSDGVPQIIEQQIVSKSGDYLFKVIPGAYYLAAFVDINGDGTYQPNEHGKILGNPTTINVDAQEEKHIDPLVISGLVVLPENHKIAVKHVVGIWENNGSVIALSDSCFNRDNYKMGLWQPLNFLDNNLGGLFFLQEYNPNKIPVLFIHGVMGGPTDWEGIINGLDKEHFQPWVVYYPTGLRLDIISEYLVEAVTRLQIKHGFSEYAIISHSMGGLISRSFVKKHIELDQNNIDKIRMVMSINSPMNGMKSAASGVKNSPIVVPSWRDLAPNSQFLNEINSWNWPHTIPFHLVVSYEDGDSGDGVVPLQSQCSPKLQSEATRMYIYNNNHVGTLHNPEFIKNINSILNKPF